MKFPDSYFEDEVREGFYIPSLMKRAWAAQMEVLDIVNSICEKYQIRYFAEWGTLLGAVRHGGRIPWDDDIDICMLRKDYERFIQVVEGELPQECMFFDYHNTDGFDDMLGRIINSRVHVVEGKLLEKYHGFPYVAGIDIFWLDDLPPDSGKEKQYQEEVQSIYRLLHGIEQNEKNGGIFSPEELEYHIQRLEETCQVSIRRGEPLKKQLHEILDEKAHDISRASDIQEITNLYIWRNNQSFHLPKENYEKGVMLPFENTKLLVPSGYEDILARKYGESWRVPVRSGGLHDYPSYAKQQKFLEEEQAAELFEYKFSAGDVQAVREKRKQKETLQRKVKEIIPLFQTAHKEICQEIRMGDEASSLSLLADCQETAIQLGTLIEKERGGEHPIITKLEQYCEELFQIHGKILSGIAKPDDYAASCEERLSGYTDVLFSMAENDWKERQEIVFVPYKASLWKSMEAVWQAAIEAEDTDVYVVPAPYYYKDAFGRAKMDEPHYETEGYPENVELTFYEDYSMAQHHPDQIVIQCPYDEYNYGFTLHPFFYAKNLAQYTDKLVYIPAFVMDEIGPGDDRARETLKSYCNMPGVVYADVVMVQSESMKEKYVELLTEFAGEGTNPVWKEKIVIGE